MRERKRTVLLRRSVVLITTLAAGLAVTGMAAAGAAADPAPPKVVELDSAPQEFRHPSKPDAQRASSDVLAVADEGESRKRLRSAGATERAEAADVTAAATSAGSSYTPVTPVRVLDTRNGIGVPAGPLGTQDVITLDLSDRVPADVTAVVLNVTGVTPTNGTYITVWPAGTPRTIASSLNVSAGEIRANAVTVSLSGGAVHVYNNFGTTNVLADLAGYYAPATGSRFTSMSPTRVLDTRNSGGALGAGGTRTINLSGRVPTTATAVTFNLTGTGATTGTFVTAWPTGQTRPNASTLNLVRGATTPNLVTVALGTNRTVTVYNNSGSTHLVADLAGYYATDRGHSFYQLTPARVIDTRPGDPLPGGWIATIDLSPDLPPAASTVVGNLTGTNVQTSGTYLTAFPTGTTRPNASNLNLMAGQTWANSITVALGPGRQLDVFNLSGNVDFLLDIAGYFAPPPAACAADCVNSWGDNEFGLLGVGTTGGLSTEPGRIDGLSGITSVTGGDINAYALREDGRVFSWGLDHRAGLGTGKPYGMSTVPVQVNTLANITQVAAGVYSAYGVDNQGRAWAWGDNFNGALGDGSMSDRRAPVRVSNLPADVVQVAGGYDTGYALRANGTVWVWGTNAGSFGNGQYGTGCDQSPVGPGCRALNPIQVPGLTGVVSISATWNGAFAVKSDGTVWAWGYNGAGQLGIGTVGGPACDSNILAPNCMALSPTQIPGLTGVTEVAAGSAAATYALKSDGTVVSWGFNGAGQLGNGTTGSDCSSVTGPNCVQPSPGPVVDLTDVTDLAGGTNHGLAMRSDGSVWSWGSNFYGQLSGPDLWSDVPVQVSGVSGASVVGSSGWTSFAVT
jgi:alpha-tubulin suppressor-like RCC1 family protein